MSLRPRKVAILGTATGWEDAPFSKKGWEIWVCNRAGLSMRPFDRLFEIHNNLDYESAHARDRYLDALRKTKQEVISIVPLGTPKNTVIDRAAMHARYGGAIWFSSSFAYMVAHAMDLGVKEIGFWGVDMESREEYVAQFSGVRHMIDIARERGVAVHIPDRSMLLRDPLPYPDRFETPLAMYLEKNAAQLNRMVGETRWKLESAKERYWILKGRAQASVGSSDFLNELDDAERRMEEIKDAYGRVKGEIWAIQHIRRLFVFNVVEPDPGEESAIDPLNSGPT